MRTYFNILLLLILLISTAFPRTIKLRWDEVDDVILTYRVYWGTRSGNYTEFIDAGNRSSFELAGLRDNIRYYLAVTAVDYWGNESAFSNEVVSSGELAPAESPGKYHLDVNYPNPFNSGTSFRFTLPKDSDIDLSIYNSLGQKIKVLAEGPFQAGRRQVWWDGTNAFGEAVSSGAYFCVLQVGPIRLTRSITLLR